MVRNVINNNCMKKFSPSQKKEIIKAFEKLMEIFQEYVQQFSYSMDNERIMLE